jgi:SAM-dependent methyltransferase
MDSHDKLNTEVIPLGSTATITTTQISPSTTASTPYTLPPNLKSRIKATYDEISPAYNSMTIYNPLRRLDYLEKLKSYILASPPSPASQPPSSSSPNPPLIKVLELGSGAGVPVTESLLKDGRFHVTANDISTTQIVLGKALCGGTGRVDWVEADMIDLQFPDGTFDAVMGLYSLIHLPRDEQTEMFGKIRRWLRPGGYVLLNFASDDMEGQAMDKWYSETGWMFWSGWGLDGTIRRIEEAGLRIVFSEVASDDQPFLWVIARAP